MLRAVLLCILVSIIGAQVVEDMLCAGRTWEPECTTGNVRIIAASYGKTDGSFCGGTDQDSFVVNCAIDVAETLRTMCGGKPKCSVPVEGGDVCAGSSKFLQIVWGCETGIPQNKVNNKNVNIFVTTSATRANAVAMHGQMVKGANLYVFVDPADGLTEVRWFLDQGNTVITIDDTAPFEFYPGAAWDTTVLPDGTHRVLAILAFSDNTFGSIDATVTVNNALPKAAAATQKASDMYVDTTTVTQTEPTVPTAVPWTLFGIGAAVAIVLLVVIIVKSRSA